MGLNIGDSLLPSPILCSLRVMPLTVSFRNFWKGFNPYAFFIPLIASSAECEVTLAPIKSQCDLEVVSVVDTRFIALKAAGMIRDRIRMGLRIPEHRHSKYPMPSHLAKASIWYTGENIRPPVGLFDRTWSFEPDSKLLGNLNFPVWWLLFPELVDNSSSSIDEGNFLGEKISVSEVSSNRSLAESNREKFCCAFLGYNEGGRGAVLKALETLGQVDIFGRLSGNIIEKKLDVALDYKFMFCGENDSYPGYITEKIFDAWGAGCVPIWLGIDQGKNLNPAAYISPWDYRSLDDFIVHVESIYQSDSERLAIVNSVLLAKPPDLSELKQDLKALLARKINND